MLPRGEQPLTLFAKTMRDAKTLYDAILYHPPPPPSTASPACCDGGTLAPPAVATIPCSCAHEGPHLGYCWRGYDAYRFLEHYKHSQDPLLGEVGRILAGVPAHAEPEPLWWGNSTVSPPSSSPSHTPLLSDDCVADRTYRTRLMDVIQSFSGSQQYHNVLLERWKVAHPHYGEDDERTELDYRIDCFLGVEQEWCDRIVALLDAGEDPNEAVYLCNSIEGFSLSADDDVLLAGRRKKWGDYFEYPLHAFIRSAHRHAIDRFRDLAGGADIPDEDNDVRVRLTREATWGPTLRVLERFVTAGADLNALNGHRETPLFVACALAQYSVCWVSSLIDAGAKAVRLSDPPTACAPSEGIPLMIRTEENYLSVFLRSAIRGEIFILPALAQQAVATFHRLVTVAEAPFDSVDAKRRSFLMFCIDEFCDGGLPDEQFVGILRDYVKPDTMNVVCPRTKMTPLMALFAHQCSLDLLEVCGALGWDLTKFRTRDGQGILEYVCRDLLGKASPVESMQAINGLLDINLAPMGVASDVSLDDATSPAGPSCRKAVGLDGRERSWHSRTPPLHLLLRSFIGELANSDPGPDSYAFDGAFQNLVERFMAAEGFDINAVDGETKATVLDIVCASPLFPRRWIMDCVVARHEAFVTQHSCDCPPPLILLLRCAEEGLCDGDAALIRCLVGAGSELNGRSYSALAAAITVGAPMSCLTYLADAGGSLLGVHSEDESKERPLSLMLRTASAGTSRRAEVVDFCHGILQKEGLAALFAHTFSPSPRGDMVPVVSEADVYQFLGMKDDPTSVSTFFSNFTFFMQLGLQISPSNEPMVLFCFITRWIPFLLNKSYRVGDDGDLTVFRDSQTATFDHLLLVLEDMASSGCHRSCGLLRAAHILSETHPREGFCVLLELFHEYGIPSSQTSSIEDTGLVLHSMFSHHFALLAQLNQSSLHQLLTFQHWRLMDEDEELGVLLWNCMCSIASALPLGLSSAPEEPEGNTLLHVACIKSGKMGDGAFQIIRILLDHCNPTVANKYGEWPLQLLLSGWDYARSPPHLIRELVNCFLRRGVRINSPDRSGVTPLMAACRIKHPPHLPCPELIQWMVATMGADPTCASMEGQATALHYLAATRIPDSNGSALRNLFKFLIERGALVDETDAAGFTPLMIACNAPLLNVRSRGGISAAAAWYRTTGMSLRMSKNVILGLLRDCSADPFNHVTVAAGEAYGSKREKRTSCAAFRAFCANAANMDDASDAAMNEILDAFIARGVDINQTIRWAFFDDDAPQYADKQIPKSAIGETPLMTAARAVAAKPQLGMRFITLLLKKGADPNIVCYAALRGRWSGALRSPWTMVAEEKDDSGTQFMGRLPVAEMMDCMLDNPSSFSDDAILSAIDTFVAHGAQMGNPSLQRTPLVLAMGVHPLRRFANTVVALRLCGMTPIEPAADLLTGIIGSLINVIAKDEHRDGPEAAEVLHSHLRLCEMVAPLMTQTDERTVLEDMQSLVYHAATTRRAVGPAIVRIMLAIGLKICGVSHTRQFAEKENHFPPSLYALLIGPQMSFQDSDSAYEATAASLRLCMSPICGPYGDGRPLEGTYFVCLGRFKARTRATKLFGDDTRDPLRPIMLLLDSGIDTENELCLPGWMHYVLEFLEVCGGTNRHPNG